MPRAPRTRYQSLSPPPSTTTARKLHLCPADGCSYSTVNSGDLSRHMKQHLSPEERANHMYKCPFCDYQELQKYNVGVHIAKHKDVKPFACPSCEKSYSDPATLTRHKKAKHNHRPHHTARYYLAREQDASEPPSPTPKRREEALVISTEAGVGRACLVRITGR
ncbi:hypothetical protein BDZ89DRAFT_487603 [Hymenopellis radicata]|nr:hypothetical protein BDZ89DRAFT_487603 [Hymenopellis radicata]